MDYPINNNTFLDIKCFLLTVISVYSMRLFIPHSPSFIWVILFILIYSCFFKVRQQKHNTQTIIAASVLGFLFSLMSQYTPINTDPRFPELSGTVSRDENENLIHYLHVRHLTDGYWQEPASSGKESIPLFDGTGLDN